jgi:hypothetical protein
VRSNNLPDAIGHKHHDLVSYVSDGSGLDNKEKLTPHVAFLVKPPMLDETKLIHIMYGIVLTKRTTMC